MPTWTPAALSSETRPLKTLCWRLVEAQHLVSTLKIVDTLSEQDLLEEILEETKPALPPECRHLHYLLATPFRYGPYPKGSRFRRLGMTAGVYYASERPETAVAELAFYRLLFFAESPATPWPANAAQFTGFSVLAATEHALDLSVPPLAADRPVWTHPTDYGPCQHLADVARAAAVEALRYESVRDPMTGRNLALLTCRAFAASEPGQRQTWRMRLGNYGVHAICDHPSARVEFPRDTFSRDPRVRNLIWER